MLQHLKRAKVNFSLYTKKTNNTSKLSFYPYKNSKITKLKKKKKKKLFFLYQLVCSVLAGTPKIGWYAWYMANTPGI